MKEQSAEQAGNGVAEALARDLIEEGNRHDSAIDQLEQKLIARAKARGMSDAQIIELLKPKDR